MFWLRATIVNEPIYLSNDLRHEYIKNILQEFDRIARIKDDIPVVVLLGNLNSFSDRKKIKYPWKNLETTLSLCSIYSINTSDSLYSIYTKYPNNIINQPGVHYTPFANKLVAAIINKNL